MAAFLILILLVSLGFLPTLIALIDITKSKFKANDKIIWLLIVLFTSFFGAILYFLIGRDQRIKTTESRSEIKNV